MVDLPTRLAPSSNTTYFSEYSFFHSNNLAYAFLLKYIITSTNISMLYHRIYISSIYIFYIMCISSVFYVVCLYLYSKTLFYITICKTLKTVIWLKRNSNYLSSFLVLLIFSVSSIPIALILRNGIFQIILFSMHPEILAMHPAGENHCHKFSYRNSKPCSCDAKYTRQR